MHRALRWLAVAICLVVGPRPTESQEPEAISAWHLAPGEAAVFSTERTPANPMLSSRYAVYASEIANGCEFRPTVVSLEDLLLSYALSIPPREGTISIDEHRPILSTYPAGGDTHVVGTLQVDRPREGFLRVRGELDLTPTGGYAATIGARVYALWRAPGLPQEASAEVYEWTPRDPQFAQMPVVQRTALAIQEIVNLRDAAFEARIEAAIASGRQRLASIIAREQTPGRLALGTFALLRAGEPPASGTINTAFERLAGMSITQTYDISLYIMALEALGIVREPPTAGTQARYTRQHPPDLRRIAAATEFLLRIEVRGEGVWGYPFAEAPASYDHSNTQFAVLALQSAAQAGIRIPPQIFDEIRRHFVANQSADGPATPLHEAPPWPPGTAEEPEPASTTAREGGTGAEEGRRARGFYYSGQAQPEYAYGSMTCAGISSLVIAREWLQRAGAVSPGDLAALDAAVQDGLAWMESHFTVRQNPGNGSWPLYYLYSLEKVGELCRIDTLGAHDWYREGALELLNLQAADGSWPTDPTTDTAFALLFLCRATLPTDFDLGGAARLATGAGGGEGRVFLDGTGWVDGPGVIRRLAEDERAIGPAGDIVEAMDPAERPLLLPAIADVLRGEPPRRVERFLIDAAHEITDERLRDADEIAAWHGRWNALREADSYEAIRQEAEDALRSDAPLLRQAACRAVLRLRAVDAGSVLIDRLATEGDPDVRAEIYQVLFSLAGDGFGYDPRASRARRDEAIERFRAWWRQAMQGR